MPFESENLEDFEATKPHLECTAALIDPGNNSHFLLEDHNKILPNLPRSFSCFCCKFENPFLTPLPITNNPMKCSDGIVTEKPKPRICSVGQTCCDTRVENLKHKLDELEKCNNELRKQLDGAVEEKNDAYCRLEVISAAHESRITEMHCVIAELTKKLRVKQDTTILEESEHDGSEWSFQCESAKWPDDVDDSTAKNITENKPSPELQTEVTLHSTTGHRNQVEILQEEILHLKAKIAYLQSQIANENDSSPEAHQQRNEKDVLPEATIDMNIDNGNTKCAYENWNILAKQLPHEENHQEYYALTKENIKHVSKQQAIVPITKVAGRIKLHRTLENQSLADSAVLSNDMNLIDVAENRMANIIPSDALIDEDHPQELKVETLKLQRRVERLKARNSVLSLTLNECKKHCEHLYLLCGKYESNAIALQAALNCSDRSIEAYDVMLALLESKLALLNEKSAVAQESRRAVEAVARHLLDRLDSERNFNENSLGPWQNTVCISNSQIIDPWTPEDDNRLRNHVSKLKGRRSTIQNTVVTFESPFYSEPEVRKPLSDSNKGNAHENPQLELEVAVLVQELLSLKEDIFESKQKTKHTDDDKHIAYEKVRLLQLALNQFQPHLTDSGVLADFAPKNRSSYSEVDHGTTVERQLIEAVTREAQLKGRIQTTIQSASYTKNSTEDKYTKVQNNLTELQKANLNLSRSLDLCKRKYQHRIKCLEQKIVELTKAFEQQPCPSDNIPETTL